MSTADSSQQRASLLPVFLIVLVDVFGMTLVIPLLPIYAESLDASPLQATLLVSVFAACQLVSGPLLGHLSDRTGRKPMLIVSQIGSCLGFFVMAAASSLGMLFLARVIDGVTAGNLSIAQAYIADNTPPERRARAFGIIGIAFGLGFFVGPAVTGFLSARYALNAPIYLAAAMSAISVVATAILLKDRPREERTARPKLDALAWSTYAQYFSRPGLRGRLLQFLFFMLAFSAFISGVALFAERRYVWNGMPFGPREVGYLFAFVGFLGIILQGGLIGRLVSRFGEPALVTAGFTAVAVGHFGLGLSYGVPSLILVSVIASFGHGILRPALTSIISRQAGGHEQGAVLGITQSMTSLAAIVAPIAAGLLIQYGQLTLWAWLSAVLGAVGIFLAKGQTDRDGLAFKASGSNPAVRL